MLAEQPAIDQRRQVLAALGGEFEAVLNRACTARSWLRHSWLTTSDTGCPAGWCRGSALPDLRPFADLPRELERKFEMKAMLKPVKWISLAFVVFLSNAPSLQSRPWPRSAPNAGDYLIINDNRGAGDIVLVFWLASPLISCFGGPAGGSGSARQVRRDRRWPWPWDQGGNVQVRSHGGAAGHGCAE